MNLSRFAIGFLNLIFLIQVTYAGERPGFAFLNTEMSARGAALAGAMIAKSGEVHGLFHNPASLAGIEGIAWSTNYLNHLLDMGGGNLMIAKSTNKGSFGIGAASIDYGTFERLDDRGNNVGADFVASDLLLSFGYGYQIVSFLSVGANLKWASSNIDEYSANAMVFDAGFVYENSELDLTIGGGIFNLGKSSAFVDTEDPLPTNFKLGLSKLLAHLPMRLNVEGRWLSSPPPKECGENIPPVECFFKGIVPWKLLVSGEIMISPNFNLVIGMNSNRLDLDTSSLGEDFFSGGSLGFGLNFEKWRVDYALTSYGGAGSIQRFGVSSGF